jgi:hypothetical protein
LSELELARAVVERTGRVRDDGDDLDGELADLLAAQEVSAESPPQGWEGDEPAAEQAVVLAAVPGDLPPPPPPPPPPPDAAEERLEDEVGRARRYLREHPRRPPAGEELIAWLEARRVVGLDPPAGWRPPPRRHRRRTL